MIDVGNINSLVSTFKSISSSLGSAFYATGCGIVGSIGIIRRPECNAMIALVGLRHLQKTPRTDELPGFFLGIEKNRGTGEIYADVPAKINLRGVRYSASGFVLTHQRRFSLPSPTELTFRSHPGHMGKWLLKWTVRPWSQRPD